MLVLLLLIPHVFGKDTSKDVHVIEKIDTCPEIGYYFKRVSKQNEVELSCYLCFCQSNNTAVCWPRDNRRCKEKQYYHIGRRKRESRPRRSSGFSDIFLRDATRDVFNRQAPQQCKPHESSFSEGCPPADWCIGCTVCDCDANGHWDCHILSFCPDNKGKKQMKKRKGSLLNNNVKRQLPTTKVNPNRTTMKPNKKSQTKTTNKNPIKNRKIQVDKNKINSKQNKNLNVKSKTSLMKKPKVPMKKKNVKLKGNKQINKKEDKSNQKPKASVNLNTRKANAKMNTQTDSTAIFAQNILKQVMASVEKILNENQKNFNKSITQMDNNKMPKYFKKDSKNTKKNINYDQLKPKSESKINKKHRSKQIIKRKQDEKLGSYARRKREVTTYNFFNSKRDNISFFKPDTEKKSLVNNNTISEFVLKNPIWDIRNTSSYYSYDVYNYDIFRDTSSSTEPQSVSNLNNITNDIIIPKGITEINSFLQNVLKKTTNEKILEETTTSSFETIDQKENYNKTNNDSGVYSYGQYDIIKKNITCGKICNLKKVLKKIVISFDKRNSTFTSNKKKKFNILGKLKSFFGNMFLKNSTRIIKSKQNPHYPFQRNKIINSLCKKIGTCKFNSTDKLLQSKLNELKQESKNILKSVRIINGLLKLLGMKEQETFTTKENFMNHERILTMILKDEYESYYNSANLTDTQRTQIYCIKENTLVFIQSVERLAYILNDIIQILTNSNVNKLKVSRRYHRCARRHLNVTNKNNSISEKLEKLRNMLIHYNLVQNVFMKQMYDIITSLEKSKNSTDLIKPVKVSHKIDNNNSSIAIDDYVKNIIKNLRKLKDLAQKLSFRKRKRRSTMGDDDAIEYLLMLMEYILKQNRPINVSPAYDGIDLIIEAIKNSPNINPIKKKVSVYTTTSEYNPNSYHEKTNRSEIFAQGLQVFESLDEEDTNMMNDSSSNDIKNEPLTTTPKIYNLNKKIEALEKIVKNVSKEIRRYEIFVDDEENDMPFNDTTKEIVIEPETSTVNEYKLPVITFSPIEKEAEKVNIKKMTLEWVEENYKTEKIQLQLKETTTETFSKATRTTKGKDKYNNNISSFSEEHDEEKGKKVKPESEEIYKRQMNLFNTLGYGTEKTVIDLDSREEKYNSESFPLYFA